MFYTEHSTHVKAVEICHNSKIIKVPITAISQHNQSLT